VVSIWIPCIWAYWDPFNWAWMIRCHSLRCSRAELGAELYSDDRFNLRSYAITLTYMVDVWYIIRCIIRCSSPKTQELLMQCYGILRNHRCFLHPESPIASCSKYSGRKRSYLSKQSFRNDLDSIGQRFSNFLFRVPLLYSTKIHVPLGRIF